MSFFDAPLVSGVSDRVRFGRNSSVWAAVER
jgi:hypothetical protein